MAYSKLLNHLQLVGGIKRSSNGAWQLQWQQPVDIPAQGNKSWRYNAKDIKAIKGCWSLVVWRVISRVQPISDGWPQ